MEEAQQKAAVLIEALPYMQRFREKIVVVKLGGRALEDAGTAERVLTDVVFMEQVGMRPLLVHGGGVFISQAMRERGKTPVFVHGRRVTDAETLEIAKDVLVNRVNAFIVKTVNWRGGRALGVCGPEPYAIEADRLTGASPDGSPVDLGFVGKVVNVDSARLTGLCEAGLVPVLPPLASGKEGNTYNVNADDVAYRVAIAVRAEKLVFLSDTHGVRTDPQRPDSCASSLHKSDITKLIQAGVISGGMLPKVEACTRALEQGVGKAHIVDGRIPHSLLLEIFTDRGIGTEIVM